MLPYQGKRLGHYLFKSRCQIPYLAFCCLTTVVVREEVGYGVDFVFERVLLLTVRSEGDGFRIINIEIRSF